MAFHSKVGSISRSARTNRRDKESILGLSGWLFADLLLAIAVIFLVVQDKSGGGPPPSTTTTSTVTSTTVPAENVGLIADSEQQLIVRISGGAKVSNSTDWKNLMLSKARTKIYLGERAEKARLETSWVALRQRGYRVGFVMWFAKTNSLSGQTSRRGIPNLVRFLVEQGLIDSDQLVGGDPSRFPNIPDYADGSLARSDLRLRIFLFKKLEY